jgi:hypothetical protein
LPIFCPRQIAGARRQNRIARSLVLHFMRGRSRHWIGEFTPLSQRKRRILAIELGMALFIKRHSERDEAGHPEKILCLVRAAELA